MEVELLSLNKASGRIVFRVQKYSHAIEFNLIHITSPSVILILRK